MTVHSLDVAIVLVVALFAGLGAIRGFVSEFFSLAGWMAAIALGAALSPLLAPRLAGSIHNVTMRQLAAFFLVFVVVFIVFAILGFVVRRIVVKDGVKIVDHVFGGLLGAGRGVAILVVLAMLANLTSLPHELWWRSSRLAPYIQSVTGVVARYLPIKVARSLGYS